MPFQEAFALLRVAQAAIGCVLGGANSAAIRASSALPLIRLTVARDGQRFPEGH